MTAATIREGRPLFWRRFARYFVVLVVLGGAWLTFICRHAWFTDNFGVVDPGRAYRVAQPFENLPNIIQTRRIASILNLRGGSAADAWYVDEVRATEQFGVDFYDLPMSATRRPNRRELLGLIDVLNHCRYPLLIHCKSGSDRTGLASALYLLLQKKEPPREALRAFSLEFGHFPLFGPQRLHEPIAEYAAWLERSRLAHDPERFENWVKHQYVDADLYKPVPAIPPGPRIARENVSGDPSKTLPRR